MREGEEEEESRGACEGREEKKRERRGEERRGASEGRGESKGEEEERRKKVPAREGERREKK